LKREEKMRYSQSKATCRHGVYYSSNCGECEQEDWEIEQSGGIDKCLNCGRYKSGNQLNQDQVCKIGCVNPNEY
jgi:hypothetical protein